MGSCHLSKKTSGFSKQMLPLLSTDCHRLLDVLFSLSNCADCLARQCAQWLRMLALELDDLFWGPGFDTWLLCELGQHVWRFYPAGCPFVKWG